MTVYHEKDLYNIVKNAPIGICVLDAGTLTGEIVNEHFLEIAGKPEEAIIGKFYWDAFAETRAYYEDELATVVAEGKPYYANEVELMLVRHGKEENVFVTFVYSPVKNDDGKVTKVAVWVLENTLQVKARQNIETSEARMKMVMDSTRLGTWDFNPRTGELTWSDECKNIYGLPPGVAINFDLFADHIHPDDKDYALSGIQKSMDPNGNGTYDITYRILRYSDKSERWIRAQGKVYFDAEKQVDRFIGTVLDIHEAKTTAERSAMLSAIITSTDDAVISKTLDGIITSWNASAQRIFGYSAEEIIGHPVLVLIPDNRKNEEPGILSRLRRGERVDHFETKRVTKDGKLIDLSLTISPIKDAKGNIIGISKIARDITDKKQEERKRNDFIAMVSHELKTPLTSIKSYIQVLLSKAVKEGDSFGSHALARTDAQIKKMVAMINDFLSLSRLEEAKIQLNKEIFDISLLINEVINDARIISGYENLTTNNCTAFIHADRDKIGQVLTNLVSNAVKYSPGKGNILVECRLAGKDVEVSVIDNGIGIDPVHQQRLFERFYRVDNNSINSVSGFGVGLYLSSELLRYHDSRIDVKSEPGLGSTFSFRMKLVK